MKIILDWFSLTCVDNWIWIWTALEKPFISFSFIHTVCFRCFRPSFLATHFSPPEDRRDPFIHPTTIARGAPRPILCQPWRSYYVIDSTCVLGGMMLTHERSVLPEENHANAQNRQRTTISWTKRLLVGNNESILRLLLHLSLNRTLSLSVAMIPTLCWNTSQSAKDVIGMLQILLFQILLLCIPPSRVSGAYLQCRLSWPTCTKMILLWAKKVGAVCAAWVRSSRKSKEVSTIRSTQSIKSWTPSLCKRRTFEQSRPESTRPLRNCHIGPDTRDVWLRVVSMIISIV